MQLIANLLFLWAAIGALRGLLRGRLITPSVLRLDTRAAATDTLGETQEYIVTLDTGTKTIVHDGFGNVLSTSTLGLSGVTMTDMWRLTTSFSGSADPIASNLERVDTNAFGEIGNNMSVASGVFTFPETGYYQVFFIGTYSNSSGDDRAINHAVKVTTDGGTSYNDASGNLSHIKNIGSNATYITIPAHIIIDVTSTSNQKVAFKSSIDASTSVVGDTSISRTYMTFIRLGDT